MVANSLLQYKWQELQKYLDIDGDAVMFVYTAAVIWKMLHHGLDNADAMAYGAAIGALGYSKGARNVKT